MFARSFCDKITGDCDEQDQRYVGYDPLFGDQIPSGEIKKGV